MTTRPTLDIEVLEQYFKDDEERKRLARLVDALERKQKERAKQIVAYVEAHGGKDRTTVRGDFVLAILQERGTAKWKDEFIRVAGHDEAERIAASAPLRDRLKISRVAT